MDTVDVLTVVMRFLDAVDRTSASLVARMWNEAFLATEPSTEMPVQSIDYWGKQSFVRVFRDGLYIKVAFEGHYHELFRLLPTSAEFELAKMVRICGFWTTLANFGDMCDGAVNYGFTARTVKALLMKV